MGVFTRLILSVLFLSLFHAPVAAQMFDPASWSFEKEELSEGEYLLHFDVKLEDGWYVYAQDIEDGGPIPASFTFEDNADVELIGRVSEKGEVEKEGMDEMFEMFVKKFGKSARFTQKVKVSTSTIVSGFLEFMTCNDERCLPPTEVPFSFTLAAANQKSKGGVRLIPDTTSSIDEGSPLGGGFNFGGNGNNEVTFNIGGGPGQGQINDPVKWSQSAEVLDNGNVLLKFVADIEKDWYTYSLYVEEGGPLATSFIFDDNPNVEIVGDPNENGSNVKEGYDEIFEMEVKSFLDKAEFTQEVKINKKEGSLTGFIEQMACNAELHVCTKLTDYYFTFDLATLQFVEEEVVTNTTDSTGLPPDYVIETLDMDEAASGCGIEETEKVDKGLLSIFILGFLGGLIALLTPCVFPMIPLTVSFFTKGSTDKKKGIFNAFVYGLFIFLIYLLLSIPFHLLDSINEDILNQISTNIWLNLTFFVIFVVFAISFFGYFEITLPHSIANKADSASDIGGLIGIFFMALTLAIVSFSCTGPILGSLLAGALSSDGGAMQLTAGMGGFGLALALPFALFAAFPGWLNALPKSGGWLNTVKVEIAFIELALAFKFLSNADLVIHAGILKRETFFAIWIIIGIAMFLYTIGKIKFPHDSPLKKLSTGRIGFAVLVLAFTVYLIPGVTCTEYNNLKLLSGFPPPGYYSYCADGKCPLALDCHKNDYWGAQADAQELDMPILVDMTGWACVNCRRMEEKVWVDERVFKVISEKYVLASLYVDDREELPEDEQVTLTYNGKTRKIRNIGNKWSAFSVINFKTNSQPFYVLLSPDGQLLNEPVGYTPDADDYLDWLNCGLKAYEDMKAISGK